MQRDEPATDDKIAIVPKPNTRPRPRTVVVEHDDAMPALGAVSRPERLLDIARLTRVGFKVLLNLQRLGRLVLKRKSCFLFFYLLLLG